MVRTLTLCVIGGCLFGSIALESARAQVVAPLRVTASGGAVLTGSHRVVATLGQAVIGTTSGPSFASSGGFWHPLQATVATDLEHGSAVIPGTYRLRQNYPNPFNPSTTIPFEVTRVGRVVLTVFNALGQEVQTLTDRTYAPGRYELVFEIENLPSGVYFYSLQAGDFQEVKRMVLLK